MRALVSHARRVLEKYLKLCYHGFLFCIHIKIRKLHTVGEQIHISIK